MDDFGFRWPSKSSSFLIVEFLENFFLRNLSFRLKRGYFRLNKVRASERREK